MDIRSVLIKDTTKEEREDIIRKSLDCGNILIMFGIGISQFHYVKG